MRSNRRQLARNRHADGPGVLHGRAPSVMERPAVRLCAHALIDARICKHEEVRLVRGK